MPSSYSKIANYRISIKINGARRKGAHQVIRAGTPPVGGLPPCRCGSANASVRFQPHRLRLPLNSTVGLTI